MSEQVPTIVNSKCYASWTEFGAFVFRNYLRRMAPRHKRIFASIPNNLLLLAWASIATANGIETYINDSDGDRSYFPFIDIFGDRGSNAKLMWPETRRTILRALKTRRMAIMCLYNNENPERPGYGKGNK